MELWRKFWFGATDVARIAGCSRSQAYKLIEAVNQREEQDGYLFMKGKVNKHSFCRLYHIDEAELVSAEGGEVE